VSERGAERKRGLPFRGFLLVLVTITGAVVLALEILGTRVIGTYYGSSLHVWAALLSVTLVCLALGYAIGGRIADRVPHLWVLCLFLIAAGCAVLLVPLLTGILAPLGRLLGLAWGAIASALFIFFLPLTLLAMSSPYIIRLQTRSVDGVGTISGMVYALSTVGSVAGVLAVSFLMIPVLGTQGSLRLCAGVTIGLGAVGMAICWGVRGSPFVALILLPCLIPSAGQALPGELYHTESPYGDLRVIERDEPGRGIYRMLMVNGIMQTGMPMDIDLVGSGSLLKSDSYYLELLPYFYPDLAAGRQGILIGLAGGMFARVMELYPLDLTAVEIDLKVAELARIYFGYQGEIYFPSGARHHVDVSRFPDRGPSASNTGPVRPAPPAPDERAGPGDELESQSAYQGRAVIQDGRQYLITHPQRADFIVLDAYNSDTIPFHLITREFFELAKSRLKSDGILAINYIGRPEEDFVTDSLFRTLAEVFGSGKLIAYRTRDDRTVVQVLTVFAFLGTMELMPAWAESGFGGVDPLSYELSQHTEDTNRSGGIIITDDLNPIDRARVRTALEWREQTMELMRQGGHPRPVGRRSGSLEGAACPNGRGCGDTRTRTPVPFARSVANPPLRAPQVSPEPELTPQSDDTTSTGRRAARGTRFAPRLRSATDAASFPDRSTPTGQNRTWRALAACGRTRVAGEPRLQIGHARPNTSAGLQQSDLCNGLLAAETEPGKVAQCRTSRKWMRPTRIDHAGRADQPPSGGIRTMHHPVGCYRNPTCYPAMDSSYPYAMLCRQGSQAAAHIDRKGLLPILRP